MNGWPLERNKRGTPSRRRILLVRGTQVRRGSMESSRSGVALGQPSGGSATSLRAQSCELVAPINKVKLCVNDTTRRGGFGRPLDVST